MRVSVLGKSPAWKGRESNSTGVWIRWWLDHGLPEGVRASIYVVVDSYVHKEVYERRGHQSAQEKEVEERVPEHPEKVEKEVPGFVPHFEKEITCWCQDPFQDWSRTRLEDDTSN